MSRNLLFGRVSGNEIGVGASAGFIRWTGYPGDGTIIPLAAHGIQAGDTIALTAKVSSTSGKQLRLRLEFYESEARRDPKMSTAFCQNSIKTLSVTATVPEGYPLFRVGLDANLSAGTITTNTQETITEVMLVHGDKPAVWTPAPEDYICFTPSDLEPGAISAGASAIPNRTFSSLKADGDWLTKRVRTKQPLSLQGYKCFYAVFPSGIGCFPIYFDSAGLSIEYPCEQHENSMLFSVPSNAESVALVFKKVDSSAITPADVTNVTGGVLIWLP